MTQQRRSKLAKWNWIISLIATRIGEIYSLPFVSESQFEWTVWPLAWVTGAFIFPWEKFNFGKCCHSAVSVTLVQLPHQSWRQQKSYLKIQNVSRVTLVLATIYWINHQEKRKFKKKKQFNWKCHSYHIGRSEAAWNWKERCEHWEPLPFVVVFVNAGEDLARVEQHRQDKK